MKEERLIEAQILEYVLTQYSLNKHLQIYGEKGEHATKKELKQLHDMATFEPINPNTLTEDEEKRRLHPLCFLTEKSDGSMKARACEMGGSNGNI